MYSNLLQEVEACFKDGVRSSKSDFHIMAFSYIDENKPKTVSVVLRRYDHGRIFFHTDIRSSKCQFINNKICHVLLYSKSEKMQICCDGNVKIHHENDVTEKHWKFSRDASKECYRLANSPSSKLVDDVLNSEKLPLSEAYKNFSVIEFNLKTVDRLKLFHSGNERYFLELDNQAAYKLNP